jgi:DNA mismatch endonuclease (patch repair protein)
MMSGIRGKDTKPEMIVRKTLFAAGYRFRLHRKDLPGVPDIVLPSRRVAIFVHGCFWHMHAGCKCAKLPSTRLEFWNEKLSGNALRDQKALDALMSKGWRVLIVWECATRDAASLAALTESIIHWIDGDTSSGSISFATTR